MDGPSTWQKIKDATGITNIQQTFSDPHASGWDKAGSIFGAIFYDANNLLIAASILGGDPEFAAEEEGLVEGGEGLLSDLEDVVDACRGGLGFAATTKVVTAQRTSYWHDPS